MNGLITTLYYLGRIVMIVMIGIVTITMLIATIAIRNMASLATARSINQGPY